MDETIRRPGPVAGWPRCPAAPLRSPSRCCFTSWGTLSPTGPSDSPVRPCGPLRQPVGFGGVSPPLSGRRPRGRGDDWRAVASGGRRRGGTDRLLPARHRLRARVPSVRSGAVFRGARHRAGHTHALAGADSVRFREAPWIPGHIGCWFIVTAVPRGRRVRAIVPTFVGAAVVGGPLWVLWLGPLILP